LKYFPLSLRTFVCANCFTERKPIDIGSTSLTWFFPVLFLTKSFSSKFFPVSNESGALASGPLLNQENWPGSMLVL
jgi:hypothetical protein